MKMRRQKTRRGGGIRGPGIGGLALAVAALVVAPTGQQAWAQSDPTAIGSGQRPFVIMVIDSSGSMEYSQQGVDDYPCTNEGAGANPQCGSRPDPLNPDAIKEWRPNEVLLGDDDDRYDDDYEKHDKGPVLIGPCYVWKQKCDHYKRPPWYPDLLKDGDYKDHMKDHLKDMRGQYDDGTETLEIEYDDLKGIRLQDDNQPRHVQIKEILTGDMILRPENKDNGDFLVNPRKHGPGCWFIPRMSGARGAAPDAWHICQDLDSSGDGDPTPTGWYENHSNAFQHLIDYNSAVPHLQEVYDYQLRTGLLDNLAGAAIFAVAMFDGSQGVLVGDEVQEPNEMALGQPLLNDAVPDDDNTIAPYNLEPEDDNNSNSTYDLGVYKIIGPSQLDIPSSLLAGLSSFVQYAISDAGFMRNRVGSSDKDDSFLIDPRGIPSNAERSVPYSFPSGLDRYAMPYQMGHQPMSGATPLAAAVRDIHMYMLFGQVEFDRDGRPVAAVTSPPATYESNPIDSEVPDNTPDQLRAENQDFTVNPVQEDPYLNCRPKHIVLMTDGFPSPERADPVGANGIKIGSDSIADDATAEAFGYADLDRYVYGRAEQEIESLVTSPALVDNVYDNSDIFKPKVHIVGLNLNDGTIDDVNSNNIPDNVEKLGRMAISGKTCALHALLQGEGRKFVPEAWGTFAIEDSFGNPISGVQGTCDPAAARSETNAKNCLVKQFESGTYDASYDYSSDGGLFTSGTCLAPALILESNDRYQTGLANEPNERPFRDDLTEALQLLFNKVLDSSGGIASRTRPTVINTLDQENERGQYRIYSGVDVAISSPYWGGLLERQTLACAAAGGDVDSEDNYKPLHEEVNAQVRPNSTSITGYLDNRRIFTSVAYALDLDGGGEDLVGRLFNLLESRSIATSNDIAFQNYRLYASESDDEFYDGSSASSRGFGPEAAVRVPMLPLQLIKAWGESSVGGASSSDWDELLAATSFDEVVGILAELRGHLLSKRERVLGGILNSNPISVGPPNLDLSIGSYRAYRELYADRASMLYVSTLDGMLHAIHTGEHDASDNEIKVREFGSPSDELAIRGGDTPGPVRQDSAGDVLSQREAWAYVPEMIRRNVALNTGRQPNLMDGTPVVQDVRLCHGTGSLNQNVQACKVAEDGSGSVPAAFQWRTVLVQGLGQAGPGYFALDVTQSGGTIGGQDAKMPDPVVLWEFDHRWERRQIQALRGQGDFEARAGYSESSLDRSIDLSDPNCPADFANALPQPITNVSQLAYMGLSVGEPAIGTVAINGISGTETVQRPVAVFSAGLNGEIPGGSNCESRLRRGRAIYVVDLQTGSILRRFLDYRSDNGDTFRFQAEVAGTPVLFDNRPGVVASRAFVGDVAGRLFRIDLSDPDITGWRVELAYDPCMDDDLMSELSGVTCDTLNDASVDHLSDRPRDLGPAAFKPAVALNAARQVTVVYGLGERADTSTADQIQAMIALTESPGSGGGTDDGTSGDMSVSWRIPFPRDPTTADVREKLTGAPTVFNYGIYFTTFIEEKDEVCKPGKSRVWGLRLQGNTFAEPEGILDFTDTSNDLNSSDITFPSDDDPATELVKWFQLEAPTLIRGTTIAFSPNCSENIADPSNPGMTQGEGASSTPELIVTTGGIQGPAGTESGGGARGDLRSVNSGELSSLRKRLASPRSRLEPLSWSIIGY